MSALIYTFVYRAELMTPTTFRQLVLVLAGALATYVVVRRLWRLAALRSVRDSLPERFVIDWQPAQPIPTDLRSAKPAVPGIPHEPSSRDLNQQPGASDEDDDLESSVYQRKVSRTRQVSFRGRRYGPLPKELVGQQVMVQLRDDQIDIVHDGTSIASFDLP